MEKLENNIVYKYADWPKVFGISETEVLECMNAAKEYSGEQSYRDWVYMYSGIHRESPHENMLRGWLACYRWIQQKNQTNVSG